MGHIIFCFYWRRHKNHFMDFAINLHQLDVIVKRQFSKSDIQLNISVKLTRGIDLSEWL